MAAGPSPASATTSMSGSASMRARRPMRISGWSSTTSTRIFGSDIGGSPRCKRQRQPHLGPGAGPAVDHQLGTQAAGPLLHAHDAEVAFARTLRLVHGEALA